MASRGVIYLFWGDQAREEQQRSLESLKRFHPELPHEVVELPAGSGLTAKAAMAERSPFDCSLFLDTDTVVLDRLDFGFEKAEQFGLACCINECPWARRYTDLEGDQIEYNTGVLFFTRKAAGVFDEWKAQSKQLDSSIVFQRDGKNCLMPQNDQAGFSEAIRKSGFNPFVLPMNWNLRPAWHKSFFGPVKIWHDRAPVPPALTFWNESQRHEAAIIRYSGDPA
jgi:hypothetical protein